MSVISIYDYWLRIHISYSPSLCTQLTMACT
nr:MAG TPA: hypothetical protein [Caudoviricetes sp.]